MFDRDNINITEYIYFCPCCNSLRDENHKRISKKYCMECKKKVDGKIIVIKKEGLYGQFCDSCYGEIEEGHNELRYSYYMFIMGKYFEWLHDTEEEPENYHDSYNNYCQQKYGEEMPYISLEDFNRLEKMCEELGELQEREKLEYLEDEHFRKVINSIK